MKIMHITGSYRWERDRSMAGFSFVELMIVLAIVGVVCAFAVTSISRSRSSIRLQNSARLFASYAEKARVDAIKSHEGTNIDITGPSSYAITMDFDGSGVTWGPFPLGPGLVFTDSSNAPYTIDVSRNVSRPHGEPMSATDFNWRGRTSQCSML